MLNLFHVRFDLAQPLQVKPTTTARNEKDRMMAVQFIVNLCTLLSFALPTAS